MNEGISFQEKTNGMLFYSLKIEKSRRKVYLCIEKSRRKVLYVYEKSRLKM